MESWSNIEVEEYFQKLKNDGIDEKVDLGLINKFLHVDLRKIDNNWVGSIDPNIINTRIPVYLWDRFYLRNNKIVISDDKLLLLQHYIKHFSHLKIQSPGFTISDLSWCYVKRVEKGYVVIDPYDTEIGEELPFDQQFEGIINYEVGPGIPYNLIVPISQWYQELFPLNKPTGFFITCKLRDYFHTDRFLECRSGDESLTIFTLDQIDVYSILSPFIDKFELKQDLGEYYLTIYTPIVLYNKWYDQAWDNRKKYKHELKIVTNQYLLNPLCEIMLEYWNPHDISF